MPKKNKQRRLPGILDEWDIFKITSQTDDRVVLECRICSREFRGTIRSTGNFHRHVRIWHPHLIRQVEEKRLERSVQLYKERMLKKRIRKGRVAVVMEVEEEIEEKLDKTEQQFIITPSPSSDHLRQKILLQ
ncbi:hypothetical protein ACLKA6_004382 [Drosophila palustris]